PNPGFRAQANSATECGYVATDRGIVFDSHIAAESCDFTADLTADTNRTQEAGHVSGLLVGTDVDRVAKLRVLAGVPGEGDGWDHKHEKDQERLNSGLHAAGTAPFVERENAQRNRRSS